MGLTTEAASGPETDNASKGSSGIDGAITAAMDAQETRDLSSILKEGGEKKAEPKPKAEAKPSDDDTAGEDSASEDTSEVEASKPESEDDTSADASLTAPKHWPDADKQAFGKMTREGQEIALRLAKNLEGGFTRKSQELSDKARFADSVRGLIDQPTRQQLQMAGMDEGGYFRYLHSLQQEASRDPVGYLKKAMQHLGVKPDQLGISQTPQTPPGTPPNQDAELAALLADPKVSQLEAQLQKLQSRIEQDDQARQQAQQAEHANIVNTQQTWVRTFRESLDEHGQLAHPHFDTVVRHMGALMDTDPDLAKLQDGPEKMQAAYEMAVWARPDLRQALIDNEAQKKIHDAQKKQDAQRAKKVTSVKPAAGVVSTKTKPNSLDDALSQSFSKLGL